jgi:hypothetical protein
VIEQTLHDDGIERCNRGQELLASLARLDLRDGVEAGRVRRASESLAELVV